MASEQGQAAPARTRSTGRAPAPARFRPEIEGVRFAAALLVASYHIWSGRVSGGVDVFFVVSGFLITTTLLGHVTSYGRIRPLRYLGRLALRLLPAAVVVLAAVLVATRLLLPTLRWEGIGREVRASALYYENWYLIGNATDYLARFSEKSPVQHFWALSLQGQFYLIWLAVFLLASLLVRRRPEYATRTVAVLLTLVFACSLAYSIWFTAVNQPVAYFSTPARAWEFALGGLAALALRRPLAERSRLRWVLGWLGLAILLGTGLLIQVSTAFPGYAALLPTSAALMILVSARNGFRFGADRLLGHPVLVRLGGLSYGLYLWHFPVLTFWRSHRETESNGIASGIAIIGVSLLLAWLTLRVVERPLVALVERPGSRSRRRRRPTGTGRLWRPLGLTGLIAAPTVMVVIATSGFANQTDPVLTKRYLDLAEQFSEQAYDLDPCFGAMAKLPSAPASCGNTPALVGPPPELIKETQQLVPCRTVHRGVRLEVCLGGSTSPTPRRTVMFAGDSHSLTMRVGMELVAERYGWRMYYAGGRDCQTATKQKPGRTLEACSTWIKELTEYIRGRDDIDVLFTMQAAGRALEGGPEGDPAAYNAASFRAQWDLVQETVERVVVIRDNPRLFTSVVSCLAKNGITAGRKVCSRPRSESLTPDYSALAADQDGDPRTNVADVTHVFCDRQTCYPVIGGMIAYTDDAHLHTVFTRTLAQALDAAIRKATKSEASASLFGAAAPA